MYSTNSNYFKTHDRYLFQGQEMDDEVKGDGNSVNFSFRMHDPRLGRFFAIDPLTKKFPQWSPYQFGGNQVISSRELEGLEPALDLNATANISYTIGGGNTSNFRFGVGVSLTYNYTTPKFSFQTGLNVSAMATNGGITTPKSQSGQGYSEMTFSPSLAIGGRSGTPIATNYLHGNATTALMNPIVNSLTYSFNYHINDKGRTQRTGTYGARFGDVSFNVLEDHKAWAGADGEDRWWTGSGNISYQTNDISVMLGTDTYTGNSYNGASTPKDLGDFEYGGKTRTIGRKGNDFFWANQYRLDEYMMKPSGYNQSLNNAQTFLQVSTANGMMGRITSNGPGNFWSQNAIHDYLSPNFHHFKPALDKNYFQFTSGFNAVVPF